MKLHRIVFLSCLMAAIVLVVASFILPPIGVIDNSVLTAAGILLGFAALGILGNSIDEGRTARYQRGDVSIEVESKNKKKNE